MSRAEAMADLLVAHGQLTELVRGMVAGDALWTVPGHAADAVDRAHQLLTVILHNAEFLIGGTQ